MEWCCKYRSCLYEDQWWTILGPGLWVGAESTFLLLYLVLVKAGLLLCFFSLFSTVLGSGFGGQETNLASHVLALWCGSFGCWPPVSFRRPVPHLHELRSQRQFNSGLDEWHWIQASQRKTRRKSWKCIQTHTNIVNMQWNICGGSVSLTTCPETAT